MEQLTPSARAAEKALKVIDSVTTSKQLTAAGTYAVLYQLMYHHEKRLHMKLDMALTVKMRSIFYNQINKEA